MKILLLSRYGSKGASSRVRSFQYIPYLKSQGWNVDIAPLFENDYIENLYTLRRREQASFSKVRYLTQTDVPVSIFSKGPLAILKAYIKRLALLSKIRKYDLVWVEKELFPWLPAWFEIIIGKLGIPYVVDYDDAVFHKYDLNKSAIVRFLLGKKIKGVMHNSRAVIAGNSYLAEYARQAGANRVEIIPSVVDSLRYASKITSEYRVGNKAFRIGWIGSPSTVWYLSAIEDAIKEVAVRYQVELVVVGGGEISMNGVNITCVPWSESSEVQDLQSFDIGIMPLPESPYEMGKCGYKLIQYMASGVPAVASPVGINREIIVNGVNGFLAATTREWVESIELLRNNRELYAAIRLEGLMKVEREFNLVLSEKKMLSLFSDIIGFKNDEQSSCCNE